MVSVQTRGYGPRYLQFPPIDDREKNEMYHVRLYELYRQSRQKHRFGNDRAVASMRVGKTGRMAVQEVIKSKIYKLTLRAPLISPPESDSLLSRTSHAVSIDLALLCSAFSCAALHSSAHSRLSQSPQIRRVGTYLAAGYLI